MYKDTEDYFNEFSADIFSKTSLDKGHRRIEKREYQLLTDLSWLEQKSERLMFRAALEPTLFLDILFDPSSVTTQK